MFPHLKLQRLATSGFLCPMSGISLPFSFTFEGQLKARSDISEVKLTINVLSAPLQTPTQPSAPKLSFIVLSSGRKIVKSVLDCVS